MTSPIDGPDKIDHVRRPDLPWRVATLTECGRPIDGLPTISRDEFVARVRAQGQQRSAMTTCMTCWSTANRWPAWTTDPVGAIGRECAGAGYVKPERLEQFRRELQAIAALVAAHRDEFDEYLTGLGATVDLAQARARSRAAKARRNGPR